MAEGLRDGPGTRGVALNSESQGGDSIIIVILGGQRVSIREYPRSKDGGRENLEGAHLTRDSPEILPTVRLSEGIFRILTSETPCITNILWAKP